MIYICGVTTARDVRLGVTRRYSPTIMMVSLRNPKVAREHSRRGEIIQRTTADGQIYGNYRSSTYHGEQGAGW